MCARLTWIDPSPVEAPDRLVDAVGGSPLVAAALYRRGWTTAKEAAAFLDPAKYRPASPADLTGIEPAADRLMQAIYNREPICVWGDFDVDGQSATALLVSTLRDLGGAVSYHIPLRETESHGVHQAALQEVMERGAQLILTCDTGIQAYEAVEYARSRGVDFIVTDHHDLPAKLPRARAIVNPKLMDPGSPLHELPGVGCAFLLGDELYARAGQPERAGRHLDLVALGVVADVAVQQGDVRYLLQLGLETLRRNPRLGLRILMEQAEIDRESLSEQEVGFEIGPRLNALGRLADANRAVEFLTTQDLDYAKQVAKELEALNARRKLLTNQVLDAARAALARDPGASEKPMILLSHPEWPAGIIGIVAGRLAERYGKPVVLISEGQEGVARASARSVEGIDISAAIHEQQDLLLSHGGHPMAAGFSIRSDQIPSVRVGLDNSIRRQMETIEIEPRLQVDAYLDLAEVNLELIQDLERLAPFGPGNPALTLAARGVEMISRRTLGQGGEHLRVRVRGRRGAVREVLWWHAGGEELPAGHFDLAFRAHSRVYRGERKVQMEWIDARAHTSEVVSLRVSAARFAIIDMRQVLDPGEQLERITSKGGVQIWNEIRSEGPISFLGRGELKSASALAIWSIPPGPEELSAAIRQVAPEKVYLFAQEPEARGKASLLKSLAGAAKYALRTKDGEIHLSRLAAALSQREATIIHGLRVLEAWGAIDILGQRGDSLLVAAADRKPADGPSDRDALARLLEETAAFRAYYRGAAVEDLRRLIHRAKRGSRPN